MSLTKWFGEKWVDLSRPLPGGGWAECGRSSAKGKDWRKKYPKCVPLAKAKRMSPSQRKSAVARKRRAMVHAKSGKPTRVSTFANPAKKPHDTPPSEKHVEDRFVETSLRALEKTASETAPHHVSQVSDSRGKTYDFRVYRLFGASFLEWGVFDQGKVVASGSLQKTSDYRAYRAGSAAALPLYRGLGLYPAVLKKLREVYGPLQSGYMMTSGAIGAWEKVGGQYNEETGRYSLNPLVSRASSVYSAGMHERNPKEMSPLVWLLAGGGAVGLIWWLKANKDSDKSPAAGETESRALETVTLPESNPPPEKIFKVSPGANKVATAILGDHIIIGAADGYALMGDKVVANPPNTLAIVNTGKSGMTRYGVFSHDYLATASGTATITGKLNNMAAMEASPNTYVGEDYSITINVLPF